MANTHSVFRIRIPEDVEPPPPAPPFSNLNLSKISGLARKKDWTLLCDLGGVHGVIRALQTNKNDGIRGDDDDIAARKKIFGPNSNVGPERYWVYVCAREAITDPLIGILGIYILVSLGFGIRANGIKAFWPEKGSQLVEIIGLLIVTTLMNSLPIAVPRLILSAYRPHADVVRNGVKMNILLDNIVVGDVVLLKPGDKVPADGLFLDGNSLHLEKMISKKTSGKLPEHTDIGPDNPFIFSGTMVSSGHSTMVVTAVRNQKPKHEVKWIERKHDDELKRLASTLSWLGKSFAAFAFMWFLFCFAAVEEHDHHHQSHDKSDITELSIALVGILATCAIIALTSNLEGLALAVKLTLANSMESLMKDQALIKSPAICRRVASVDNICFNNNGTLISDETEVSEFWIGMINCNEDVLCNLIPAHFLGLLHQAIALNATHPHSNYTPESCLTSAEKAICKWATRKLGMIKENILSSCSILDTDPFNPVSKRSGVMIDENSTIHVHRKGAADVILPLCSRYYETNGRVHLLNGKKRVALKKIAQDMEEKGLKCVAFAYKKTASAGDFSSQELTLLALVGFENHVRKGSKKFVKDCQRAGIKPRLLTGDSALTAESLAITVGLLDEADIQPGYVVKGEEFRNYTAEERMESVDHIRVMAEATPSDKLLMVQTLKQKKHVVAYVGAGLGDAQAIKAADVGICFGTQGTAEILKASSDIIIMNKSFHLVFDILKWGRGFYNGLETYLQFLLIAVYVDLLVDFMMTLFPIGIPLLYAGAVISRGEIPTPVFQLLWRKLIFGTVAPLSLLTKHLSDELMSKPGRVLSDPLMTHDMQQNIIAQTSYQILLLMAIHFMGGSVLKLNLDERNTTIFTTYMLSQVFTLVNAKMHDRRNNLQDIHNKKFFWGVIGFITLLQVVMVEFWKCYSGTARLNSRQWAACIFMAAASIPTSVLLRYIYSIKIPYLNIKSKIE